MCQNSLSLVEKYPALVLRHVQWHLLRIQRSEGDLITQFVLPNGMRKKVDSVCKGEQLYIYIKSPYPNNGQWAVVVSQLVERLLPIPEVRGLNPVIGKNLN